MTRGQKIHCWKHGRFREWKSFATILRQTTFNDVYDVWLSWNQLTSFYKCSSSNVSCVSVWFVLRTLDIQHHLGAINENGSFLSSKCDYFSFFPPSCSSTLIIPEPSATKVKFKAFKLGNLWTFNSLPNPNFSNFLNKTGHFLFLTVSFDWFRWSRLKNRRNCAQCIQEDDSGSIKQVRQQYIGCIGINYSFSQIFMLCQNDGVTNFSTIATGIQTQLHLLEGPFFRTLPQPRRTMGSYFSLNSCSNVKMWLRGQQIISYL